MKDPVTVIYTSHFDSARMGGQTSLVALLKNIDRNIIRPVVILPKKGELSDIFEKNGIDVCYVPFEFIDCGKIFSPFRDFIDIYSKITWRHYINIYKIYKIIKKYHASLIHIDEESDMVIAGIAALLSNIPIIWHVRVNAPWKHDSLLSRIADGIIGVSNAARKRIDKKFLYKYKTVYDGVDTSYFIPSESRYSLRTTLNIPHDRLILAQIGQVKAGKGVLDVVDAIALLDKHLREKVLLLIIGDPIPDDNKTPCAIKSKILANDGLEQSIIVMSHKNNIYKWMQAADLVLLPSYPGVEGLPRVLIESMSCGTPCLGTDVDGINDVISVDSGFIVPCNSPVSINNVIIDIIKNPSIIQKYSKKVRSYAVSMFDIKVHANDMVEYYRNFILN